MHVLSDMFDLSPAPSGESSLLVALRGKYRTHIYTIHILILASTDAKPSNRNVRI